MFVAPTFMPASWGVTVLLKSLGYPGTLAVVLILMSLTFVEGKPIMNIAEAMRRNVIWEMFYMLAAAWTIASALVAENVGIKMCIRDRMLPAPIGKPLALPAPIFRLQFCCIHPHGLHTTIFTSLQ